MQVYKNIHTCSKVLHHPPFLPDLLTRKEKVGEPTTKEEIDQQGV